MLCERCWRNNPAKFRVVTDVLDIKVCADCVEEALRLGLPVVLFNDFTPQANGPRTQSEEPDRLAHHSRHC